MLPNSKTKQYLHPHPVIHKVRLELSTFIKLWNRELRMLIFVTLVVGIFAAGYFWIQPVNALNQATRSIWEESSSSEIFSKWQNAYDKSGIFQIYNDSSAGNKLYKSLATYTKEVGSRNSLRYIKLTEFTLENKGIKLVPFDVPTTYTDDKNFPTGEEYISALGEPGNKEVQFFELKRPGDESGKPFNVDIQITSNGKSRLISTGKQDISDLNAQLQSQFGLLIDAIKKDNLKQFTDVVIPGQDFGAVKSSGIYKQLVSDLNGGEISVVVDEGQFDEYVTVGRLRITKPNCPAAQGIKVVYNKSTSQYKFADVTAFLDGLCSESLRQRLVTNGVLNCSDCSLAPVGKKYALSSKYAPRTVATGVSGGGTLMSPSRDALQRFAAAAKASGISIKVNSAYRSYQTQVNTFNYWVNREMQTGLPRKEAEAKANTYSARPGHSEHQLGTTVDISCGSCDAFDTNNALNRQLYNFIEENAHKYGFVVSYTDVAFEFTGYKPEPWHLRYVGVEYATELYNRNYLHNNANYLEKYLIEKGKY